MYKYTRKRLLDIYKLTSKVNKKWAKPFIKDLLAKEDKLEDAWRCSYCQTWNEWKYDTCSLCGSKFKDLFGKDIDKPLAQKEDRKECDCWRQLDKTAMKGKHGDYCSSTPSPLEGFEEIKEISDKDLAGSSHAVIKIAYKVNSLISNQKKLYQYIKEKI